MDFRILCLGDIVGRPGRHAATACVGKMIDAGQVDFVVANAENAAGGSGITPDTFTELTDAGVDVVTCGDHSFRNPKGHSLFQHERNILRPANWPDAADGRGDCVVTARDGTKVGVLHLLGRVFMGPADSPFTAADRLMPELLEQTPVVIVDMHCEATSEKHGMGRHLDGRASGVFGTHTHVPTADVCVLPGGTGYITDTGMCGPYDSILGRRTDRVLKNFVTGMPARFDVANGDPRACGVLFTVNRETGRATAAERIEQAVRA